MAKSNTETKPEKPYEGFPLFAHATKRWAKKIRGRTHYFGHWNDPEGALERLNLEWPYLSQGRTPPTSESHGGGCTMRQMCNVFLTAKHHLVEAGELSERSFRDYFEICEMLIEHFGRGRQVDDLRPDDFRKLRKTMATRLNAVALKNEINRCRVVFKFAHDEKLIDAPVEYGQSFKRPSALTLRRNRNQAGPRLFDSKEILRILDAVDGKPVIKDEESGKMKSIRVDPIMRAMILLGCNCGFGNTDISSLPRSAVDLANGWVEFPRPKTEIGRRIPLWPETAKALKVAIASRPEPLDPVDDSLCFLTSNGRQWVRMQERSKQDDVKAAKQKQKSKYKRLVPIDALSQRFGRLLKKLKINGRRGLGFYTLRHVFETVAGESRDQVAVNAIMGHVDSSMGAVYRERISDDRLNAAVECVRSWLFEQDSNERTTTNEPQPDDPTSEPELT